jgi:Putative lumazine-binding
LNKEKCFREKGNRTTAPPKEPMRRATLQLSIQPSGATRRHMEMTMDDLQAIQSAIYDYFDVLYRCDLEAFDRVFATTCSLQTVKDSNVVLISQADYRAVIKDRKSPESQGSRRENEIILIDVVNAKTAIAKVRARINAAVFVDYLSFLNLNGSWQIVGKIYQELA